MRIAIVQFGVLHGTYETLMAGGSETYYAQRYSVEYVRDLSERAGFVGVCGFLSDAPANIQLTPRLASAAVPLLPRGRIDVGATIAVLEDWRPEKLILQTPSLPILSWALKSGVDVLPAFADSFDRSTLRRRLDAALLARALRDPRIRAVGNHNLPAARGLMAIGAPADKIYPWDWPHALRPQDRPSKRLPTPPAQVVFVGTVSEEKGVGDIVEAAAILSARGTRFALTIIGDGPFLAAGRERVAAHGLEDKVKFAGRQTHDQAVAALEGATIALTPSRHVYPEGLPMTIYEALATRTPLILSDHPMFLPYFRSSPAARVVPEKSPAALADAIDAYLTDADGYAAASEATAAEWRRIKCDLLWGDLISAWIGERGLSLEGIADRRLDRLIAGSTMRA